MKRVLLGILIIVLLIAGISLGARKWLIDTSAAEKKAAAAKDVAAVRAATAALDRINADLYEEKVNYADYSLRLRDAAAAVISFSPVTAEGSNAKGDLQKAIVYYVAAGEAWKWSDQGAWPADVRTALHWATDYPEVVAVYPEITAPYPQIAAGTGTPAIDDLGVEPPAPKARPDEARELAFAVARKWLAHAKNRLIQ